MKNILLIASLLMGVSAFAEEKTCTVKGMHCKGCTEMVEGKICDEAKYSACEVKVTDAKKQMGTVRVVTKDAAQTVDEKAIGAAITDSGYEMVSCKAGGANDAPAKKAGKA